MEWRLVDYIHHLVYLFISLSFILHSSASLQKRTNFLSFRTLIMAALMKWATKALRRAPSPPMCFPTSGFETIRPSEVLDEARFEHSKKGQYYPANIGYVLSTKYRIIGKLGFGTTSTVWLARDLEVGKIRFFNLHSDSLTGTEVINM